MHTGDMEVHLARFFGPRSKLIVPNVSWGLGFRHELDLIVVTQAGYATEVEIKVSMSDLRADKHKRHNHESPKIKQLFFAVPSYIGDKALQHIPDEAGLIIVEEGNDHWPKPKCRYTKPAKVRKYARKLSEKEVHHLGRLAAVRIWNLKEHNYRLRRENAELRKELKKCMNAARTSKK